MNKLLLNNDDNMNDLVFKSNTELIIETDNIEKNINIIVMENVNLKILQLSNNAKSNILIKLLSNSNVIYNRVLNDSNDSVKVILDGENANIEFNTDMVNHSNMMNYQNIVHNAKNTMSIINNNGINYSNNDLHIKVDIVVSNNALFCNSVQNNNIVSMSNGKNYILPNLIVDNNDVNLSHSAHIGDFDEKSIFYLKSRGISEKESKELLIRGFLLSNMQKNKNHIDKIIKFLKI